MSKDDGEKPPENQGGEMSGLLLGQRHCLPLVWQRWVFPLEVNMSCRGWRLVKLQSKRLAVWLPQLLKHVLSLARERL